MVTREREKERRDSLILILLIILFGFLCILLASSWALRFVPSWRLPANMGSNLDPNSFFLTSRPVNLLEPIDPAILTNPPWLDTFLTPGAVFSTRTPRPQPTDTPLVLPSRTNTPIPSPSATATTIFFPVNTPTRTPTNVVSVPTSTPPIAIPTSTYTPITPLPQVDLQITKSDGVPAYIPGGTLNYTIIVTNNGPSAVTGAVVSDALPAQITGWTWVCQSETNGANGCDGVTNSTTNFTDTVNLPNGGSITYQVTAQVSGAASGSLTNIASVTAPAGYTETNAADNTATDTDVLAATADLQITKTDNATHYAANVSVQYVIVASNAGPSAVTGATVADTFPASPGNLLGISWTCAASPGASCTATGGGDINDLVNLPVGGSVTYTVNASVVPTPTGSLVNTATITAPAGITDPNLANNTATDTDTLITANPPPPGVGTAPDGSTYNLPQGGSLVLARTIVADGDVGTYDLVYYEYNNGGYVFFDMVLVEISDGRNWYPVFDWGNEVRDTNTNLDYNILPYPLGAPFPPPTGTRYEDDERQIPLANFYNNSGVVIDIDLPWVPAGTYSFVRISAYPQPPDFDGQLEVDAVEVCPVAGCPFP